MGRSGTSTARRQRARRREFFDKYFDARGYLQCFVRWGANDGPDDAFENFNRWPELHALGASDDILRMYTQGHEGLLKQYTEARTTEVPIARQGMYHEDFIVQSDWMHHGEGLQLFNRMGLSVPQDATYQARARRFAGFYMAEDPGAPNYDPTLKIIRSMQNGSRGPMLRKATALDWVGDPFDVDAVRRRARRVVVRAVPRALRGIHRRRRRPLPESRGDDAADQRVSADRRSEIQALGRRLHGRVAESHAPERRHHPQPRRSRRHGRRRRRQVVGRRVRLGIQPDQSGHRPPRGSQSHRVGARPASATRCC